MSEQLEVTASALAKVVAKLDAAVVSLEWQKHALFAVLALHGKTAYDGSVCEECLHVAPCPTRELAMDMVRELRERIAFLEAGDDSRTTS